MPCKDLYRFVLGLIFGITVMACGSLRQEQMTAKQKEAIIIGERFIAEHHADFDKNRKKLVLYDEGDHWEVTYELPENMVGGAPVVVIDKQTMKVITSYRTQ